MGNKINNGNKNSIKNSNKSSADLLETWEENVTISFDINKNEDQLSFIKDHIIEKEFEILSSLIDSNPNNEQRFYETSDPYKNRYSNIKPFSDNRIILGNNDYINASKINSPFMNSFIATQGPVSNTISDFWQMVWEQNSRMILMMCETMENRSSKCAQYWPIFSLKNSELNFSNGLSVKITTDTQLDINLTERKFILTNENGMENREITQLHFRNWPDHGIPNIEKTYESFEKINEKIDNYFEYYEKTNPVIVHCSAGVGRTGTLIGIYNIHYIFKRCFEMQKETIVLNVFNIVRKLKEQRYWMVQTYSQYEMIYSFLDIFIRKNQYFCKIKK